MKEGYDCLEQKQQQQALLRFNKAVLRDSKNIEALKSCANILLDLNRPLEATIYSQSALALQSDSSTLTIHAKALYLIGLYADALDCFEHIIAEEPNNYIAIGQRALCLTHLNRHDEAVQAYEQALAYSYHQDVWIHYNYSLCLLTMGKLSLGFTRFEYRWLCTLRQKHRVWKLPEFASIDMLYGKSILIHTEQGLGDSIQFFRYIPLLVQLGARVYFEIQPGLIPLFYTWRHTVHFIAAGSSLPACDYYCSVMSLARLFKTEMETIPKSIPYVFPNIQAFEAIQAKLGSSTHRRVGIAWKGSAFNPMNQIRSLTLDALLTVHQPNLNFICLQKDVDLEEKKQLDQHKIIYHGFELSTMAGTAALIACLDLIITIDTSIAHLAAAMGKIVYILLPFSADWRWFLEREDSPWYPSVRLFRQEQHGDWSAPLNNIKNILRTLQLPEHHHLTNDQLYRHILINNPTNHHAAEKIALIAFQQNNMADAIQFMQQAVEIAPEQLVYRRNLGELLCRAGQLEAAIASHLITIRMEPHNAENHFLLALAYNNNHQFELAIQHYQIALSYDQSYGLAWNNLGAALENAGDRHQAKSAYGTAIRLNPNHAEAQNNLGAIYSEEGQIEKACAHFEAAIAAKPDFVEAHYNLSLVKKYTLEDPHLDFLKNIMQKIEHYPIQARIHYYFALGKAFDDTEQYALAFQAYAEGNRLHHAYKPWNKTKLCELIEQIPQVFGQSFFTSTTQTEETRCPIFIVGMPRAGTTLIEQILCSHEHIYGAGELSILDDVIQEACHAAGLPFSTWVTQLTDKDFAALGKKYLDRTWKLAPDKAFIIDKMPGNCFYVGMIYRMLPTAKVIHAIRDPMDSCFSCFTHLFKSSMLFAYDLTTLGEYYLLYAQTMQYWRDNLPSNYIFDLPYEQMVANHEKLSKQLVAYIGLSWDPNCLKFYKNDRPVRTASITQVRKPIYKTSVKRWQHFAENLQPLLDIVGPYRHNQAALTVSPESVEVLNNLGALLLQQQQFKQALEYLSRAIAIAPAFAQTQCNIGLTFLNLDQYHYALIHLEKALELKPDYAEAYYGISKIHLHWHQWVDSERAIHKALVINPHQIEFHLLKADIYHAQGYDKEALACLDQTLSISPKHVNICLAKGNILMEMGEISAAETEFLRAAAGSILDHQILAHYSLVHLRKINPDNLSFNQLLSIANNAHIVSPSKREYIYFALGKCHDDMGEWKKAFEYFSLGCQSKRARITYDPAEQIEFTNKLIGCFTEQTFEHLRAFANPSALPIFIVGMPRSGTTLVEHILSSHSAVHGAGELKHFHTLTTMYYPENIQQLSAEICHTITNHYLSYLRRLSPHMMRITDKMPHNFIAIGLIHALFPNAKIIHVERNPMDTCLSCYTKLFTEGHLYSYDLTELGQYYQCYERIMNHWRNILPSNAWLNIKYESVVNHLDEEAKRLIDFCDLTWDPACLNFYESKRQIRTASFMQARQPAYTSSIERWKHYEDELMPLIQALHFDS